MLTCLYSAAPAISERGVGDEPVELLKLGLHSRHILDYLLAAIPLQEHMQQVRVAEQAGQGRPQFVTGHRQEVLFQAVEVCELLVGLF